MSKIKPELSMDIINKHCDIVISVEYMEMAICPKVKVGSFASKLLEGHLQNAGLYKENNTDCMMRGNHELIINGEDNIKNAIELGLDFIGAKDIFPDAYAKKWADTIIQR